MHVLSSTIAVSLGPGPAAQAAAGGESWPRTLTPLQPPFGMLQGKALKGMSGGPVMDVHCGVVGIIKGYSTNSVYSTLDEVDAWLQEAGE